VTQPLKRADALVRFSKDHHFALLLVWKIRQGIRLSVAPARMRAYINFFFENYLLQHFKEEEELLFAELDKDDLLRLKAEKDHYDLQKIHLLLKIQDEPDAFSEFAAKLDQHIRFEERILFPRLQNTLDEKKLNAILQRMEELNQTVVEDNWNDMFWVDTGITRAAKKIT
jgi:iron-sulfur cluster repair protein YtfE (RIC family)